MSQAADKGAGLCAVSQIACQVVIPHYDLTKLRGIDLMVGVTRE